MCGVSGETLMNKMTLRRLVTLPLGLPLVAVALMVKPWIRLRVGRLRSERIGHYLMNTELTLCATETQELNAGKPVCDLYFDVEPVANEQVQRMWRRVLSTGPRLVLEPSYLIFRALGLRSFIIEAPAEDRDLHDALYQSAPHLSFTMSEEDLAQGLLRELLPAPDLPWVCIHQRDPSYLQVSLGNRDWSYHSYRDSPIEDYLPAIRELVMRDYQVVRMGKVVERALPIDHPLVVDYPHHELRSDFLDVYLASKCAFFLSTGSGIDSVATVFRRPQLLVNYPLPFHPLISVPSHLFIYQHFHDLHSDRPLGLSDLYQRKAWTIFSSQGFRNADIQITRNSPQEIAEATIEMVERVSGTWHESDLDEELQADFWRSFPRIPQIHGWSPFRARIGAHFLRGNQYLLH